MNHFSQSVESRLRFFFSPNLGLDFYRTLFEHAAISDDTNVAQMFYFVK